MKTINRLALVILFETVTLGAVSFMALTERVSETSCVAERDRFVEYLDSSLTMARAAYESCQERYDYCSTQIEQAQWGVH